MQNTQQMQTHDRANPSGDMTLLAIIKLDLGPSVFERELSGYGRDREMMDAACAR